jgi:hypothetical protein
MNRTLNSLVVAALALVLVQYSCANEWVPAEIIAVVKAEISQAGPIGSTASAQNRSPNNPTNIKTSGKQGSSLVVKRSYLDEWAPLDTIRTSVIPFEP